MANVVTRLRETVMDRIRIHESYQAVFGTPDGQRVLRHICQNAYIFKTTFVRGDVNETNLREGQRRLALAILRYATRDHKELQKMVAESLSNEDTT